MPGLGAERMFIPAGSPLPVLDATVSETGHPLEWSEYRGDILVIQTFASWCPPCKEAMSHYSEVLHKHEGHGIRVLALSFDKDKNLYERWLADNQSNYKAIFARANVHEGDWRKTLDEFGGGLPGFYIVSRDGQVAVTYRGFSSRWVNNPELSLNEDQRLIVGLRAAGVELEAGTN